LKITTPRPKLEEYDDAVDWVSCDWHDR
jgi:hypothetical protein